MVNPENEQNTEQKILIAARQVFLEKGMMGARMQDIADRAGINKALLHYYFRNKEKLFDVIFLQAAEKFMPKIASVILSDLPLFEKIEVFVREYIDLLSQNPYLPLFMMNEINRNPNEFFLKKWKGKRPPMEKFMEHIVQEMQKGTIKEINPLHLLMNMISMCIFPFVARPMIQYVAGVNDEQFKTLMEQRKTEVSRFIIDSIKK